MPNVGVPSGLSRAAIVLDRVAFVSGVGLAGLAALVAGYAVGSLAVADVLVSDWSERAAVTFMAALAVTLVLGALVAGFSLLRSVAAACAVLLVVAAASMAQLTGLVGPPALDLADQAPLEGISLVDGRPPQVDKLWILPSRVWEVGTAVPPSQVIDRISEAPGWRVDEADYSAVRALPWGYELRVEVVSGSVHGLGWPTTVRMERVVPLDPSGPADFVLQALSSS